jgi:DNA-binding MarR family transcriptional regulator
MANKETERCATLVMETIPLVMRTIGGEMKKRHEAEVSVPQFRALMFIKCHAGVSLSRVAEHLGSTISSASKLVDGLVERGYVKRESGVSDRRRIILALTELGEATLESVHREGVGYLAEILAKVSATERATVKQAMEILRECFASARTAGCSAENALRQGERICK